MRIGVQRYIDGFVAHQLLDRLDVYAGTDEVAGEAVPEFMVVGSVRIEAGGNYGRAERADAACVVGKRTCGDDSSVRVSWRAHFVLQTVRYGHGSEFPALADKRNLAVGDVLPAQVAGLKIAEPCKRHERPELAECRARSCSQDGVDFLGRPEAFCGAFELRPAYVFERVPDGLVDALREREHGLGELQNLAGGLRRVFGGDGGRKVDGVLVAHLGNERLSSRCGPVDKIRKSQLVSADGRVARGVCDLDGIDELILELDQVRVGLVARESFRKKLLRVHQIEPGDGIGFFLGAEGNDVEQAVFRNPAIPGHVALAFVLLEDAVTFHFVSPRQNLWRRTKTR